MRRGPARVAPGPNRSAAIEMVIEGGPRPTVRQSARELRMFAATILAFAERDLRVKYKQAVLGIGWAVLQPLAFMGIFTFTLGHLAKVSGGGVPYAAFALSALVGWTFLQNAVAYGAESLLTDAPLIRKVYFPREVPVLGAVLSAGVDLVIGLVLFALVGPFLGARVSVAWLLAPLLGLLLAYVGVGIACGLAALNVYYRDFRHALPFLLQFWLFASPVAYPLSLVPHRWRAWYVALNPAAGVLEGFRRTLALGRLPDLRLLGVSFLAGTVLLVIGYRLFKSLEPNFADVV